MKESKNYLRVDKVSGNSQLKTSSSPLFIANLKSVGYKNGSHVRMRGV